MKYIYTILLSILSVLSLQVYSQEKAADTSLKAKPPQQMQKVIKSGEGQEFWLCFMKNYMEQNTTPKQIDLALFITGDFDAKVTIEFAKTGYKEIVQLKAGTVIMVKLDKLTQTVNIGKIDADQAVHITSDRPITVYGLNKRFQTTDSFLGYPVEVLAKEYMVMSYSARSEFSSLLAVVATENNTEVTITPTVETVDNKPADKPFVVTMNKGDVYQVAGKYKNNGHKQCDLTGSTVSSNKKIAVFSGHQCANVPTNISACNHLVEQMPPIQTWGKHFYIGKLSMRSRYVFRVLAAHDDTKVFRDTTLLAILNKGEFIEQEAKTNIQVTADKPVLVAQYSEGQDIDGLGDPMMLLVSPTQQFLKKYRFATPVSGDWHHIINAVVPTKSIKTFRINGTGVDADMFSQFGVSKFSVASIKLPYGSHTVECSQPFGLYSYGFGFGNIDAYDAYGSIGGQSFVDYEPIEDTVPPQAEIIQKAKKGLLLSDDGSDDTGIFDIYALEQINMKVKIPDFSEGVPSVMLDFSFIDANSPGKFVIRTRDMSLNDVIYTVCYVFDNTTQEYVYIVNEGPDNDCMSTKSIILGLFYSHSYNNYSPDFTATGGINGAVGFIGNTGSSGLFGISASRYLLRGFNVSTKLSLITNSAVFSSTDTVKSFVKDSSSGNYAPYYVGKDIELKNINLNWDLGLDYQLSEFIYLAGGLSGSFALTKKANCNERIYFPPGYVYDNAENSRLTSETLSSISTFRFGVYIGPGVQCNIGRGFHVFGDINYYYYFNSMLNDADLFMNQVNIKLGLKYKLQ